MRKEIEDPPPMVAGGGQDRCHGKHQRAGTHTDENRPPKYTCRACGAPTLETAGDLCPRCWRKRAVERAILRWRRLLGVDR